jgi:hypothetical protein
MIDYSQHSEAELVDMFGHLDPRYTGAEEPLEFQIEFGDAKGPTGLMWSSNGLGFVGAGTLVTDSFFRAFVGTRLQCPHLLAFVLSKNTLFMFRGIANVESQGRLVRFEYACAQVQSAPICVWLADAKAASRLVEILPKRRTKDFKPDLTG